MAGWLTLMLVIAVAGREATRELAVFQIMETALGDRPVMLCPLVHRAGGWAALKTARLRSMWRATWCTTQRSSPGSPR